MSESSKDTDKYLFYQAQILIDERDYAGAVAAIQAMSERGQAHRDTKELLGSAYAGACGLELLKLANDIANSGGTTLFNMLLYSMKAGDATSTAQCKLAEEALLSISADAASRDLDENILLAFVEFAKIGSVLATRADSDGDGIVDAGFNSCSAAAISDQEIGELGTGITISLASIQASGSTAAGDAIATITALCSQIDNVLKIALGDPSYSGFCDRTDSAAWAPEELRAIRSLTRSNEIGLKTCNDTIANCLCP